MTIACILAGKDHSTYADRTVYGLRFVERLQRQFREFNFDEVFLVGAVSDPAVQQNSIAEFTAFLKNSGSPEDLSLFLVASNVIMDDRLIKFMRERKEDIQLTPQGGFVKISGDRVKKFIELLDRAPTIDQMIDFTRRQPEGFSIKTVTPSNFDSYIEDLRLNFVPYFFQYEKNSDLRAIENQMYEANFKGTMDFIATYIYKYPVREITRFLSQFPFITPNQITFLSIVSSFAVPLFFAVGWIGAAIVTGWCMFIFDSVDGKLARLTVRLSRTAGIIEHATSAPALFLWFTGMTWYFTGGQWLSFSYTNTLAGWVLMILYWVDKGVNGIFRMKFKREIYDFSPLDKAFHLIACRRAIIMLIITVGYVTGNLETSFHFLAFWMACSFLFHLIRALWIGLSLRQQN